MCVLVVGKAAADANAAAWAAYYSQYQQQPQAPMTPTGGAPGTTQANGQGNLAPLPPITASGSLLGCIHYEPNRSNWNETGRNIPQFVQ